MSGKSVVKYLTSSFAVILSLTLSVSASAQSLYERLGEMPALECWVDQGLKIITKDERINDYFAGDLNAGQPLNLRDSLVEFACAATGGPCVYQGRDMSCSHAGLGIGHDAFNYFIHDLKKAAKICRRRGKNGWLPEPAYSELNKVLLSLRPPIVQDDPGENPAGTAACP